MRIREYKLASPVEKDQRWTADGESAYTLTFERKRLGQFEPVYGGWGMRLNDFDAFTIEGHDVALAAIWYEHSRGGHAEARWHVVWRGTLVGSFVCSAVDNQLVLGIGNDGRPRVGCYLTRASRRYEGSKSPKTDTGYDVVALSLARSEEIGRLPIEVPFSALAEPDTPGRYTAFRVGLSPFRVRLVSDKSGRVRIRVSTLVKEVAGLLREPVVVSLESLLAKLGSFDDK